MKKESEKTRAAAPPGGPKTVTKADVMTREERLMQARRDSERTHTERLRRSSSSPPTRTRASSSPRWRKSGATSCTSSPPT